MQVLAPVKVFLYVAGGLIVIGSHAGNHSGGPRARSSTTPSRSRRQPAAAPAWQSWCSMRYGLARGVYANEAGYGTASVVVRHRAQRSAGTAGTERRDRGIRHLVRHLEHQRAVDPRHRRLAVRPDERGGRRAGVRHVDSGRRLDAGGVRVSLRLYGAHRLVGTTASSSCSISSGPRIVTAVSLAVLPADPARRNLAGRRGVELGRPDERTAGLSERRRPHRTERGGGRRGADAGPPFGRRECPGTLTVRGGLLEPERPFGWHCSVPHPRAYLHSVFAPSLLLARPLARPCAALPHLVPPCADVSMHVD